MPVLNTREIWLNGTKLDPGSGGDSTKTQNIGNATPGTTPFTGLITTAYLEATGTVTAQELIVNGNNVQQSIDSLNAKSQNITGQNGLTSIFGDLDVSGMLNCGGDAEFTGSVGVIGPMLLGQNLDVVGSITSMESITSTNITNLETKTQNLVSMPGVTSVSGSLEVSGQLVNTQITDLNTKTANMSTSGTTTIFAGPVNGSDLLLTGTISSLNGNFTGDLTTSTIHSTSNVIIDGTLTNSIITDLTSRTQNLTATSGSTTVIGPLTVNGSQSITGNLTVTGSINGGSGSSSACQYAYLRFLENSAAWASGGYALNTMLFDSGNMEGITGAYYNPFTGIITLPSGYYTITIRGIFQNTTSNEIYVMFGKSTAANRLECVTYMQKTYNQPVAEFQMAFEFQNPSSTGYKVFLSHGATTTGFIQGTTSAYPIHNVLIVRNGDYVATPIIPLPTLNLTYTTVGTAAVSSTKVRQGSTSLYLPGASSNRVNIENFPATTYLNGDWTIEYYLYVPTGIATTEISPFSMSNAVTTGSALLYPATFPSQNKIMWYVGTTSAVTWDIVNGTFNVPISQGAWNHVAVCYTNNTKYEFYCNGVLNSSVSNTTKKLGPLLTCINLGALRVNNTQPIGGYGTYIDCLRISSSVRYTGSTYNPPIGYVADAASVYINNFDGSIQPS